MVAVKTEGAQNRADHKDVIKIEGNLKEDGASVEQRTMVRPPKKARRDREDELRSKYKAWFDKAAPGDWVELPADLVPGDTVKVVGVPDGDPYKGKIGIWNGLLKAIDFVDMEKHKISTRFLRVVLQKEVD
jgi:hypothetical protein